MTVQPAELLTLQEVAALLKTSRTGVYRILNDPQQPLKSIRVGKSRRIHPADLDAYLEKLRKAA